ncbi:hypothetical protein BGZ83_003798 [Gryganskiella cystojenkinii]|nr:hypothetical protein BGZ83_003798 [Gryganskiella cystojenkinii]
MSTAGVTEHTEEDLLGDEETDLPTIDVAASQLLTAAKSKGKKVRRLNDDRHSNNSKRMRISNVDIDQEDDDVEEEEENNDDEEDEEEDEVHDEEEENGEGRALRLQGSDDQAEDDSVDPYNDLLMSLTQSGSSSTQQ